MAESLEALRGPIEETVAALDRRADVGRQLPHRADLIEINQRLARRVVEAHEQWLEEAQAALRARR